MSSILHPPKMKPWKFLDTFFFTWCITRICFAFVVSFCFLWPSHSASLGGLLVLWMDSSLQSMLILESIYLVGVNILPFYYIVH